MKTSSLHSGRIAAIAGRALLIGVSLFAALGAAEMVCRIMGWGRGIVYERGLYRASSDPTLGYELTPAYAGESYGTPVKVDAMGFRDDAIPSQPKPGFFRILCVGDSFTFGMGVRGEDAWPHVLSRIMTPPPGFQRIEVINGGVCGYNLEQYCAEIKAKGIRLHPNLIIVGLVENDLAPPFYVRDGYLCVPRKKTSLPIPAKRWFQTHSYFYQFASFRYQQWLVGRLREKNPQLAREIQAQDTDPAAAGRAGTALREVVAMASTNGIRIVGAILDAPAPSPIPALCKEAGLPCIPTTIEDCNRLPDRHPNPAAHQAYAEQIIRALPGLLK